MKASILEWLVAYAEAGLFLVLVITAIRLCLKDRRRHKLQEQYPKLRELTRRRS